MQGVKTQKLGQEPQKTSRTTKGYWFFARFEQRVPTMSMLNSRDAQGYPLQVYDFVPNPKTPGANW